MGLYLRIYANSTLINLMLIKPYVYQTLLILNPTLIKPY